MVQFQDLSEDLLYIIVSYLENDKRSLQDLALSCRLLRDVSQRFFVRNATINCISQSTTPWAIPGGEVWPMPARIQGMTLPLQLFLRTLEERPDLVAHVHRLELNVLRESLYWDYTIHSIRRVVRLLTNLREICYSSSDYKVWHNELPLPLTENAEYAHDNIRRIHWNHSMTIDTLFRCFALPHIASIYCRSLRSNNLSNGDRTLDLIRPPVGSSSIKELAIGSNSYISHEELRRVLQQPRCLEKLTINSEDDSRKSLSNAHLSWLLEPVRNSLLELKIPYQTISPMIDTAPVDFSSFTSLCELYAPFRCLVGIGEEGSPNSSGFLPPRLTDLTIACRFFYPSRAVAENAEQNLQNMMGWLSSLDRRGGQPKEVLHVTLENAEAATTWHGDIHEDRFELLMTYLPILQGKGFVRFEWATRPSRVEE
jgi:hypothetical protein